MESNEMNITFKAWALKLARLPYFLRPGRVLFVLASASIARPTPRFTSTQTLFLYFPKTAEKSFSRWMPRCMWERISKFYEHPARSILNFWKKDMVFKVFSVP